MLAHTDPYRLKLMIINQNKRFSICLVEEKKKRRKSIYCATITIFMLSTNH